MKNKKKLAFLTLAMTMGMVLGACNPAPASSKSNTSSGPAETSTSSSSSSESTSSSSSSSSSVVATLVSISVTAPTKVAYTTADTALDLAGMVVTATYSDGSTKAIATGYTVSTVDFSTTGEKTVTVTYEGKTATFKITVAAILVSITVTPPTKLVYTTADTALDLAGMVVKANYSDNSQKTITEGYTVSSVDFTSIGEKTVTVTYQGKTDSFKVTVNNQKFTVKFVVNGVEVKSYEVENGQTAAYDGDTPTKAGDANAVKYRFKGWDKDLTQPITQDTTFTAVFAEYAAEVMVDDFESYESSPEVADANWVAIGWKDNGWSEQTNAAVSLGTNSVEGNKALRLDAWRNGSYYKMAKKFPTNTFDKSVNAMKFRLMVPENCDIQVILYASCVIGGTQQSPAFYYPLKAQSSEYVEYTLPLDDAAWDLWNQHEGKSIASVAEWTGIHQDDLMSYLTKIEISIKGTVENNLPYHGFLDSLRFVTIDNPVKAEVETMGQYTKYTGLLNDGHTVKVELGTNGAATATVIDMETPQQIPGNVVIDANKNMTFTSADAGVTLVYKAQLKNGGQSMKFVEASGAFASAVTGVDLNAVQVVDNYEQYATDGQAYCLKYPDINARSGCRGAYYSEYCAGGSASAPWGGATWSLLGSDGEQLKLKQDQAGAHSGNNYLCLKHSKSVAFRYMQWGLFDGTADRNNFRGSKLSFWAKTKDLVNKFKVYMYSQPNPRLSTMENEVKIGVFEQTEAIGQWKHFEIDLNPNLTYYGFMITMDKNTTLPTNESYLYIDDVEVYTASPYATYVPPVVNKALVPGNAYLGKIGGLINATLRIKSDTEVTLAAPGMAMELNGTYTIAEDELTMVVGGATYKATISEDLDKLTFISVEGEGQVAGALNNLSFDIIRGENVESYTETGRSIKKGDEDETKNSGSSGAFYIDMYKGGSTTSPVGGTGWDLTGSGAGAALNKEDAAEGSQSLKLLNSQWGNMRYIQWDLYKGTAKPMTGMTSFSLYLKNYSADVTQKVKIMAYKVQKVDNAHQGASYRTELEVTLEAGQDWTKYTVALDATKTYYGFAILNTSKGSSSGKDYYVGADAMCFSNVDNDPSLNYYAKNGLALNGTITAGAATMTFGQSGAITLNCAALGGDLAGTYTMAMGEAGQLLTVQTSMGNITGTYSVNPMGKVTFTVTEVTGDLAAGVNVGAVLSNQ